MVRNGFRNHPQYVFLKPHPRRELRGTHYPKLPPVPFRATDVLFDKSWRERHRTATAKQPYLLVCPKRGQGYSHHKEDVHCRIPTFGPGLGILQLTFQ